MPSHACCGPARLFTDTRLIVTTLRQAGAVGQAYKATYRRLAYNLKDASNPDLRRRVLAREISGERLRTPRPAPPPPSNR